MFVTDPLTPQMDCDCLPPYLSIKARLGFCHATNEWLSFSFMTELFRKIQGISQLTIITSSFYTLIETMAMVGLSILLDLGVRWEIWSTLEKERSFSA